MKVLLVGDCPTHQTGTAKVMRHLGRGLAARGWDVGFAGHNHNGVPSDFEFPIWPWQRADMAPLLRAAKDFSPDRILCFGDVFFYPTLLVAKREMAGWANPPSLDFYLTVDAAPFPTAMLNLSTLDAVDQIACTTQFGVDVLGGVARCDVPTPIRPRYLARHIPLGIDPAVYHDRADCRAAGRAALPLERPVMGWVGMNQPRKHPDLAIDLIRRLKDAGGPVPQLWMKVQHKGDGAFYDLARVAEHRGLTIHEGNLPKGATPDEAVDVWFHDQWVSEPLMGEFFRRCDVFLSTAAAGAPELPVIEAAACGTPTVAVDTGSFPEVADYLAAPDEEGDWVSFEVRHPRPNVGTLCEAVLAALAGGPSRQRPGTWEATADGVDAMLRLPVPDWMEGVVV